MNVHQLQEQRAGKIAEMKAAVNNPETFDALEAEVRKLDRDIKRAATLAEFERAEQAEPDQRFEAETREFSVTKALREGADGLTGREREVHQELSKGREVRGVMIPTSVIFGEQRAMTTGGSAGNTVATNLGGMIDRLRPTMAIQQLGATIISGLTGNLDLPKLTAGPTAYWVAEDGATTASDSTFDKVSLSPKTVSGEMYMSRRLVLQNSVAIENVLRNDLAFVLAQALDAAAIQGGGANEPEGIIEAISEHGTSESELSDIAADLIGALALDDVTGTTGFLTNPAVTNAARKIKFDADSNRPLSIAETFHGERVVSTNQVPGSGSPAAHPLIFGAWSNLLVGYWSGIDILTNPYKDASKGGLWLHAFLDADVAVRHDEAFAWKAI
ncbi:phage major capsid protein [Aquamicrobium defluvii]|uniref:HK97 family phage major capsid protein n=1 Tax=Aquamicrobium defluvii TaxID=69279 RepID=A0A4R6YGB8_9HYPH|nr:phage major capsid protein [Aquamicrobium defluvii]TDR35471.1 HK97 family phage major capsid protein [Aquamicrobium defluvii]